MRSLFSRSPNIICIVRIRLSLSEWIQLHKQKKLFHCNISKFFSTKNSTSKWTTKIVNGLCNSRCFCCGNAQKFKGDYRITLTSLKVTSLKYHICLLASQEEMVKTDLWPFHCSKMTPHSTFCESIVLPRKRQKIQQNALLSFIRFSVSLFNLSTQIILISISF